MPSVLAAIVSTSSVATWLCHHNYGDNASGLPVHIQDVRWKIRDCSVTQSLREESEHLGMFAMFRNDYEALHQGRDFAAGLSRPGFTFFFELLANRSTDLEMVRMDTAWLDSVADDLMDLRDFPTINTSNIRPRFTRAVHSTGKILGVIEESNQIVLYYRKDLFETFGHTSFPNGSWDELTSVAMDIQTKQRASLPADSQDFWGLAVPAKLDPAELTIALVSLLSGDGGGGVVEPDGTVSINNPRAAETLKRWASWTDLNSTSNIVPPFSVTMNSGDAVNLLKEGRAAIAMGWAHNSRGLGYHHPATHTGGVMDIAVAPIPGETGAGCSGDWYIAMSKSSRHPDLVAKWVQLFSPGNAVAQSLVGDNPPTDRRVLEDPDLHARWCAHHPLLCRSFAEHPGFWERFSERPTQGCGVLYPDCASAIARHVHKIFAGKPAEMVLADLERELNLILGKWQVGAEPEEDETSWQEITLFVLAPLSGIALVGAVLFLRKEWRRMRIPSGPSIPLSLLMSLVVAVALASVLCAVLLESDTTTRGISQDLSTSLRVQSLRLSQKSLEGKLSAMGRVPSSYFRDVASATFRTDLGDMEVDPRALSVLIDRITGEVLVSSQPQIQPEGVMIPTNETDVGVGVHPWVAALIQHTPDWQAGVLKDDVDISAGTSRGDVRINRVAVDHTPVHTPAVSYLICYFTPEGLVRESSDTALHNGICLAVALSLCGVAVTAVGVIAIALPLVDLAEDMEKVRLMQMDSLRCTGRSSWLTEMSALFLGFSGMCAMLQEYKAFLPKNIFVDGGSTSEGDRGDAPLGQAQESGVPSRASHNSAVSSSAAVSAAQQGNGVLLCSKMRSAQGICLTVRMLNANAFLSDSKDPQAVIAAILGTLERLSQGGRGILHPFPANDLGEFQLSWGLVAQDCNYAERAVGAARLICESLSGIGAGRPTLAGQEGGGDGGEVGGGGGDGGGLKFSVLLASGKCKAGNLGTATTRGFGFTGALCQNLAAMKPVGDEFAETCRVILADHATSDRLKGTAKLCSAALIPAATCGGGAPGRQMVARSVGPAIVQNEEEWMYRLEASSALDPLEEPFKDLRDAYADAAAAGGGRGVHPDAIRQCVEKAEATAAASPGNLAFAAIVMRLRRLRDTQRDV